MAYLFFSFWWLIFPIMGFGFGAFGMWMSYLRERHRLELMKTYAQQGKDPAEVARLLNGVGPGPGPGPAPGPGAPPPPYDGYGYGGWGSYWGGYWGPRRWRYGRRWGPYREWRNFVVFVCLAVGFGLAAQYSGFEFGDYHHGLHPFVLVAIIMGVLAMGSLCFAIISTLFALRSGPNDR